MRLVARLRALHGIGSNIPWEWAVNTKSNKLTFANLFFLWFGAAVSVAEILTGGYLADLGFAQGMTANILGHVVGTAILVLGGIIGYREKLPSIMSMRISFGKQGSYLLSLVNVLQLVGWTAVMILLGGDAINALCKTLWGVDNQLLMSALVGLFIGIWVFIGIQGFKWLNMIAVTLLLGLTVVMSWVLFTQPAPVESVTPSGSFGVGFELAIIMPLSWFPLIADYTSMARNSKAAWFAPLLGYFFGSTWMYSIGLSGALFTGAADPTQMMIAAKLGVVALMVIGLSTVTTTFMDVFSAAMSTLNVLPNLNRRVTSVVFAALGTALAMYFDITQYEWFLYLLGSIFAPLMAILLSDYFLLRHDARNKKADLLAILSLAIGIAFYYLIKEYDLPVGPTLCTIGFTLIVHNGLRLVAGKRSESPAYRG